MTRPVITASLTTLGRAPRLPRVPGAVEAMITVDDALVTCATLRPDGTGRLAIWGVDDGHRWCSDPSYPAVLEAMDADEREATIALIEFAVGSVARHSTARAIQCALGLTAAAVADLVGEHPGKWSEYRNDKIAPGDDKVDRWLKLLAEKGHPVVLTRAADRCTARRVADGPSVEVLVRAVLAGVLGRADVEGAEALGALEEIAGVLDLAPRQVMAPTDGVPSTTTPKPTPFQAGRVAAIVTPGAAPPYDQRTAERAAWLRGFMAQLSRGLVLPPDGEA